MAWKMYSLRPILLAILGVGIGIEKYKKVDAQKTRRRDIDVLGIKKSALGCKDEK
jgi:hypothetical protein